MGKKKIRKAWCSFITRDKPIAENLEPVTFKLSVDQAAPVRSNIVIAVNYSGGRPDIAFINKPALTDNQITVPVNEGATRFSIQVIPVLRGLSMKIFMLNWKFFSLVRSWYPRVLPAYLPRYSLKTKKEGDRSLFFIEDFEICDDPEGTGNFPVGWEEAVIIQNPLGTGHCRCSSNFTGFECNAFSSTGMAGDSCEVWLITLQIPLVSFYYPNLEF